MQYVKKKIHAKNLILTHHTFLNATVALSSFSLFYILLILTVFAEW